VSCGRIILRNEVGPLLACPRLQGVVVFLQTCRQVLSISVPVKKVVDDHIREYVSSAIFDCATKLLCVSKRAESDIQKLTFNRSRVITDAMRSISRPSAAIRCRLAFNLSSIVSRCSAGTEPK
jgi:hypothetical protein